MHTAVIRDLVFLHPSWPWTYCNQSTVLTAGADGTVSVSGLDGRLLHSFYSNQNRLNAVCATPELFNQCADDGFYSTLILFSLLVGI